MDDAALVLRAREGDKEAFASIYDRYAAALHAFLASVLRDEHEAADVLHDTFLVAGSRLHQLREPSRLRPWLYAIARHRAYRVLEGRKRVEPVEEVDVSGAAEASHEEAASGGELAELVHAAAAGLNERDRIVLNLHLQGGLEGKDLGEAIGVSAEHAYVLLSRLRDQLERSLGALLVARQGRDDCAELAALLQGWDGTFSTVWRKRVARHVDGCETCGDLRRRSLRPAALLGAAPAFALPADLKDRVLGDVQLASHKGKPWPASEGGFPPPLYPSRPRRSIGLGIAAALVLLLALALRLVTGGDDDATVVAVSQGSVTTTIPVTTVHELTSTTATTPPTTVTGPTTTAPPGSTTTTTSRPEEPTTTLPREDTAAPFLTGPRVNPPTVRAGLRCSNTVDPTRSTVTVLAADPSGVRAVRLEVGGPAPMTVAMTPAGGDLWSAPLGPFPDSVISPGERLVVPLTIRAVDGAGNAATVTGSVTLRCDPIAR